MANAQVAQYLAHAGLAYTVSGSTYTLTDTNVDGRALRDLVRAASQWNFKVEKVSTAVKVMPS